MQVGDLIENNHGEIGIILWQVGVVDRYMVHWISGERYALNGYSLFYIGE